MELLVFVGALVALAVAPHLWGDDSRDWERVPVCSTSTTS